ncbi:syntabulin isoform X3 [Erpetoichthys calabaricus]|uniref:syntabulin isoform X3 n=1 Tax=Erpetoichthys calabaricus TaxID=27687 RepID=UPI0022345FB4|nr:syntabulin isoform X3 [Erpetoichthys calabaricus]
MKLHACSVTPKEQKELDKESPRSRIPRLVLRPYRPKKKGGSSPLSEDCDRRSGHSRRTISSNSSCSDDTGCPSSQSVSPSKTPSDTEHSPVDFPPLEEKQNVKRVKTEAMAEWNIPPARYKREQRPCALQRGSEADFSSSSSTGSISAQEVSMSGPTSKRSTLNRRNGAHGRLNVSSTLKPISPTATREKELLSQFYRNQPHMASSHSSSSNSGSYKGSDSSPTTREAEVEDLKTQLGRMREDWIEEECHRVEAQLALKEARKEIKQLRQVVETMKNSLLEKDKGIQKYFIDINIQNKKLETLLHSMELAQNGSMKDDPSLDYVCTLPGETMAGSSAYEKLDDGLVLEDQAEEEMADCGLLLNDEMANRIDFLDQMIPSGRQPSDDSQHYFGTAEPVSVKCGFEMLSSFCDDQLIFTEKAIQTDVVPYNSNFENLLLYLMKSQNLSPLAIANNPTLPFPEVSNMLMDLTPCDPNSAILVSPEKSEDSGVCLGPMSHNMNELDFRPLHDDSTGSNLPATSLVEKHYWSNSFLMDLLAVAVPVLPTVAWLFATQTGRTDPVYNIGALLRGCVIVGLHSLRHTSRKMFQPRFQMPASP